MRHTFIRKYSDFPVHQRCEQRRIASVSDSRPAIACYGVTLPISKTMATYSQRLPVGLNPTEPIRSSRARYCQPYRNQLNKPPPGPAFLNLGRKCERGYFSYINKNTYLRGSLGTHPLVANSDRLITKIPKKKFL